MPFDADLVASLQQPMPILDHGYIKLIEPYGSDESIVEAARMSVDKGFLGWDPDYVFGCLMCGYQYHTDTCPGPAPCGTGMWCPKCANVLHHDKEASHPGDARLLNYLYTHKHSTPFEMAGLIIEVQAPIMVFREWHRHRTQSYSEMSARYVPLPDVNYMPTVERCMMVNVANKQANAIKGANELTHASALEWLDELAHAYDVSERTYQSGLRRGLPKEVARMPVTVGRYSRMRANANLRNWLAFMTLRSTYKGPNAQWEIRQFADGLGTIIESLYPRTWALFMAN